MSVPMGDEVGMMTSADVYSLIQEGQLEQAYELASRLIRSHPGDGSLATVLFGLLQSRCEAYADADDVFSLRREFVRMRKLLPIVSPHNPSVFLPFEALEERLLIERPSIQGAVARSQTDPMLAYREVEPFLRNAMQVQEYEHEDLAWILYRYLDEGFDSLAQSEIEARLRDYLGLHNERPSELHSSFLCLAVDFAESNPAFDLYDFFREWGGDCLLDSDCEGLGEGNVEEPSLVERLVLQMLRSDQPPSVEQVVRSVHHRQAGRMRVLDIIRQPIYRQLRSQSQVLEPSECAQSLVEYCRQYSVYGPSPVHTKVLALALEVLPDPALLVAVVRAWGVENFLTVDCHAQRKEPYQLVSFAGTVARECFFYLREQSDRPSDLVDWMGKFLELVVARGDLSTEIRKALAELRIWQGRREEALAGFVDVLPEHTNPSGVWALMLDFVREDPELRLAVLASILRSKIADRALRASYQLELIEALINCQYFAEARAEIEAFVPVEVQQNYVRDSLLSELGNRGREANPEAARALRLEYCHRAVAHFYPEVEPRVLTYVPYSPTKDIFSHQLGDGTGLNVYLAAGGYPELREATPGQPVRTWYVERRMRDPYSDAYRTITVYHPLQVELMQGNPYEELPECMAYITSPKPKGRTAYVLTNTGHRGIIFPGKEGMKCRVGTYVRGRINLVRIKGMVRAQCFLPEPVAPQEAFPQFPTERAVAVVGHGDDLRNLYSLSTGPQGMLMVHHLRDEGIIPPIGTVLLVHYFVFDDGTGVHYEALAVEPTDEACPTARRIVRGRLRVWTTPDGPKYGFLDQQYYIYGPQLAYFGVVYDGMVQAELVYKGKRYDGKEMWHVLDLFYIDQAPDQF